MRGLHERALVANLWDGSSLGSVEFPQGLGNPYAVVDRETELILRYKIHMQVLLFKKCEQYCD